MAVSFLKVGPTFSVTLGGTVSKGDLISDSGANSWVQADANLAAGPDPAMAVALRGGVSGDVIRATKDAVLQAPSGTTYTAGGIMYLSGTAGGVTQTEPTGTDDLVQQVGRAITTTVYTVKCTESLFEVTVPLVYYEATAAATLADTTSDYMGAGLLAAADAVHGNVRVPRNASALHAAQTCHIGIVALDASDTYTIDVTSGHDDDNEDGTGGATDGITAAALTVDADDLDTDDVAAAFNAAGIIEPGAWLGIDINKAAEGTGGDDPVFLGVALVFRVWGLGV